MSRFTEFILSRLSRDPGAEDYLVDHYEEKHRSLEAAIAQFDGLFPDFKEDILDKRILDVGCSEGLEAIAFVNMGAREVVGIDIRTDEQIFKKLVAELAPSSNVTCIVMNAERTSFPDCSFDRVVTVSSFEHFQNPQAILAETRRLLKPGGKVYITSGVWSSPYGAHMHFFTKIPWVQFFFSEETIMKVRRLYRRDGARRFKEVEGGLNDIGVAKFKDVVRDSGLLIEFLYLNPVKNLKILTKIPYINEFFTNMIHATLRKP